MTTEHVSVPREFIEELEEIAKALFERERSETPYWSRHFGEELKAAISRGTSSQHRMANDDMVNAASLAYNDSIEQTHDGFDLPWCDEDAMRAALESFVTSLPAARVPDVKAMVERFLGWRLPKDFAPDGGVSFERHYITLIDGRVEKKEREPNSPWWPVGTNLLTADQAEQMFRYVLAAAPQAGEK